MEWYVVSVSTLRKAGYFEGELSDGKVVVRVVGFERKQREMLESHIGKIVVLQNCQTHGASKLELHPLSF